MCHDPGGHDPQIFLEVQILFLSLQTCQNYGATMIWSGQSNYIGMGCLYVRPLGALVFCEKHYMFH